MFAALIACAVGVAAFVRTASEYSSPREMGRQPARQGIPAP